MAPLQTQLIAVWKAEIAESYDLYIAARRVVSLHRVDAG
jgi:hypothetical protein